MNPPIRLVYETHMHTPLCKHAAGLPEDYAAVALRRNLKGIIVTCHNPLPNGISADVRMSADQFPEYLDMVQRARDIYRDRVDVRLGLECDFLPGLDAFLREQVRSAPFDYLLGSVHPHVREFRAMFWRGDILGFQRSYFDQLAHAAESRYFDCLAHPDLVKNQVADEWSIEKILPDICRALDRIAATGCAMELNTSGLDKGVPQMNPAPEILIEMSKRKIPVVVGSDAHTPTRVADRYLTAYATLEEAGYDKVSFFLERNRIDIPIAQARLSIRHEA